jgi:drug/metabolite transporter (DMT)-like permease
MRSRMCCGGCSPARSAMAKGDSTSHPSTWYRLMARLTASEDAREQNEEAKTHFSFVSTMGCLGAIGVVALTQSNAISLGLPESATFATLLMLLCVGIAATTGQLFLTKAFTTGSPSRISVIGLAQTAFTMLFHNQRFSPITLAGMALIVAPTAWVLLRGRAVADEPDPPT